MGGSRKKKPQGGRRILVGVTILILLAVAVFLVGKTRRQQREIEALSNEKDNLASQLEEVEGNSESLQESLARKMSETEAASAVEETAVEETEVKETELVKIVTLDGVRAGIVYAPEELDMENVRKYFQSFEIKTDGYVYGRINGKSYYDNPNVALGDLRYLKLLHYNFDHQLQVGELIVNQALAEEMLDIFRELYEAEYEIQSMYLVDNYWTGDGESSDTASIDVNNTSAFNYRPVTGGGKLSKHAYGQAIDLNPQQNPYVSYKSGTPKWYHSNANEYIERNTGLDHVITHDDLAFKLFNAHGYQWGGDWNTPKDYQHFEK